MKIARYVESGLCPVVTSTTRPAMRNASRVVITRNHESARPLEGGQALCNARGVSARLPLWRLRRAACGRIAHAATSFPSPPPIIAIPSVSASTLGTELADDPTLVYDEDAIGRGTGSLRARARRAESRAPRRARRRGDCGGTRWRRRRALASAARRSGRVGSRETSRATTSFCWLPPDSSEAFDVGVPPRTSNSAMSCRALAIIRLGRSQPQTRSGLVPVVVQRAGSRRARSRG